jgi:hypothetical protein
MRCVLCCKMGSVGLIGRQTGGPEIGRPKGVSLWPLNCPLITIYLASPWSWNSPADKPQFNKSKGTKDFLFCRRGFVIAGGFYYKITEGLRIKLFIAGILLLKGSLYRGFSVFVLHHRHFYWIVKMILETPRVGLGNFEFAFMLLTFILNIWGAWRSWWFRPRLSVATDRHKILWSKDYKLATDR